MNSKLAYFALLVILPYASGQQKPADLVGTISFNVGSDSGRVENLAVTVGDGGSGPYKAILAGDSSLPTHTIYRPRDLAPFGDNDLLPIVAFGNGGCRNTSGEFRNFLSDIASHGYLVVAIGPAGDAVVAGSEAKGGQTKASQLWDGVDWAVRQNGLEGSEYFHKIDTAKIAIMGQSCGTLQTIEVSDDPRVTTSVLLNGGDLGRLTLPPPAQIPPPPTQPNDSAASPGKGEYGNTSTPNLVNMANALDQMARRYAPYAPAPAPGGFSLPPRKDKIVFHGTVAFINGGLSDIAYKPALSEFEDFTDTPALFAFQNVGHYPATYREPHGGAFAVAVEAWLDWQLKGDTAASKAFLGSDCGLCSDPKWKIQTKNLH